MRKLGFSLALSVAVSLSWATMAAAQGPPAPKNLQVLPKDYTRAQVIGVMRTFTQGLGVRCSFCHVEGNFASDQKDTKRIARRMLRMVDAINKENFSGRPEVACYTCHRGSTHPLRVPPKVSEEPMPPSAPPAHPAPHS